MPNLEPHRLFHLSLRMRHSDLPGTIEVTGVEKTET